MRFAVLSFVSAAALLACSSSTVTFPANGDTADAGPGSSNDGGVSGNTNGDAGVTGDGGGTSADAASTFSPAAHPPMPKLANMGGPVLKTPKFVPVTWDGDSLRTQIEDFTSKLGGSQYWSTVVSEYGVGAGSSSPVHVSSAAPPTLDDTTIAQFLQDNLKAGGLLGAPDPSAIYTLIAPDGTTVTMGSGQQMGTGCQDFGGFHDEMTIGGTKIAYAVIPRCASFPPAPAHSLSGIDFVTTAMSHELGEAATDPHPNSEPGYAGTDDADFVWSILSGGENGDMCAGIDTFWVKPQDVGYTVQRLWSNASGQAGHDPCVPTVSGPYFNAAMAFTDDVTLPDPNGGNQSIKTKGLSIPVGQSKTIELDLYSDAPTGAWQLSALDPFVDPSQPASSPLDFKLDKASGQNGDKVQLTVTVKSALQQGPEPFVVQSSLNGVNTMWYGIVGTN